MQKNMIQLKQRQRGLTVVELVIAMTLSLLVVAAGIAGASKFIQSNKVSQTLEDLPLIFTKTQKAYSSAVLYTGLDITSLVNNRVFPNELVAAGAPPTVSNRLGGTITVALGTITVANDGAEFSLTGVPEEACVDIVQGMQAAAAKVTVGATVVKAINGSLDVAATGTSCAATASNTVKFLISK